MKRLGKVLKRRRLMGDISQKDLAKEIGVSQTVLSKLEGGTKVNSKAVGKVVGWLIG